MNVQIPVDYAEKRVNATDPSEVGTTAWRFIVRLQRLINLMKKCDTKGFIEMNEADAEMFDIYCAEPKAAAKRKPLKTKSGA